MKTNFFFGRTHLGSDLARLQFTSGMVRGDFNLFVINGLMVRILHSSFKPKKIQGDIKFTNVSLCLVLGAIKLGLLK